MTRILGLMRVHNGADQLQESLDHLGQHCDEICVLNERSTDRTEEILRAHPKVSNLFSVSPGVSSERWFLPEWRQFDLLYRMADNTFADWVAFIDHDERLHVDGRLSDLIARLPDDVVGFRCRLRSMWNDPDYPMLVPLMGSAASDNKIVVWRHYMGAKTWYKRFHNRHYPADLESRGEIPFVEGCELRHWSWSTLQARINRADLYTSIDPEYELNGKRIPYDKALLFGYARHQVPELIAEYKRRYAAHLAAGNDGA